MNLTNRKSIAAAPILLSAVFGALVGGAAGALYGSFYFPLIGTAFGFLIGGLGGWIAGLVGVILDHPFGYRIGGVLGAIFCTLALWFPTTVHEVWENGWQFVLPLAIAVLVGWRVDKDLSGNGMAPFNLRRVFREGAPTSGARPYRWLRSLRSKSTLVNWSPARRCACVAILLGLHTALFWMLRHHSGV